MRHRHTLARPAAGFTLIELVVVLAIMGVLAAAAVPLYELSLRRTQEHALREALRTLRSAIDAHKRAADAGLIVVVPPTAPAGTAAARAQAGWPVTLESLVDGVPLADETGQATADGRRMYFLRRLPRDPLADPALPAADTWATRSSDSPPGTWQPGADVFDVASRSDTTALDGSRHGDW